MKYYKSITAAAIIAASGAVTATEAVALPFDLGGTFTVDIVNYDPNGADGATRDDNSEATASNFNDIFGLTQSIGTNRTTASVTWTGTLNFNATPGADAGTIPDDGGTATTGITTVSDFFASGGGGSLTGGIGSLGALASKTLSAGGGSNDGGIEDRSTTTTLFRFTMANLGLDMSNIVNVRHDDGMTLVDGDGTSVAFVGPNSVRDTAVSGLSGTDFTLYYAAANGDPSILQVSAVPLPAAAWLLMFASGGLIAAKRRSARRAA